MNELTFKEKNAIVKKFFEDYQKANVAMQVLEDKDFYPIMEFMDVKETSPDFNKKEAYLLDYVEKKEILRKKIHTCDRILLALNPTYREILQKEYLLPKSEWWIEFYSKSTFYRLKKKAVDELLFYLIGE